MNKKKGRIVYVEGCPCEVVEMKVERGIIWGNELTSASSISPRPLVVAPDGSLVLPNPWDRACVSAFQPNLIATKRRLRRLARELNA